jgi:hypothetical protein
MVTLVVTVWIVQWSQNRRLDGPNKRFDDLKDDMNRRFNDVIRRLDRIETKFDDHEERIVRVEERTSLVRLG